MITKPLKTSDPFPSYVQPRSRPEAVRPSTGGQLSTRGAVYDQDEYVAPPELTPEQKRAVQEVTGRIRPEALAEFVNILLGNLISFDNATTDEVKKCEVACKNAQVPLGRITS